MKSLKDLLLEKSLTADKRNTKEYQAYGNRLADELGDTAHRALYIKLAKNENRALLEIAREQVLKSDRAVTKGKLFMWKFTQLKKAVAERT